MLVCVCVCEKSDGIALPVCVCVQKQRFGDAIMVCARTIIADSLQQIKQQWLVLPATDQSAVWRRVSPRRASGSVNSSMTRLNSQSNRVKQWKNKQLKVVFFSELCCMSAAPQFELDVADFELIPEPKPSSDSGG